MRGKSKGSRSAQEAARARMREARGHNTLLNAGNSIRATVDQANAQFGECAGKQCVACCQVFIAASSSDTGIDTWQTTKLDDIIHEGSLLYGALHERVGVNYLQPNELPETIQYHGKLISVQNQESYNGLIGQTRSDPETGAYSLADALRAALVIGAAYVSLISSAEYDPLAAAFATAVITTNDAIYVFDSHSRNDRGYPTADGTGILLRFTDFAQVTQYFKTVANMLFGSAAWPSFEVVSVQVNTAIGANAVATPKFDFQKATFAVASTRKRMSVPVVCRMSDGMCWILTSVSPTQDTILHGRLNTLRRFVSFGAIHAWFAQYGFSFCPDVSTSMSVPTVMTSQLSKYFEYEKQQQMLRTKTQKLKQESLARSKPDVKLARQSQRKVQTSMPEVKRARKDRESVQRKLPGVKQARKDRETVQRNVPDVKLARRSQRKVQTSMPCVKQARKDRETVQRNVPDVKLARRSQRKVQTSMPCVKQARKDRETVQRNVPDVKLARLSQRKVQTSMPEVKQARKHRESVQRKLPGVKQARKDRETVQRNVPDVKLARRSQRKVQTSMPGVKQARKERESVQRNFPDVKLARKSQRKQQTSRPDVRQAKQLREKAYRQYLFVRVRRQALQKQRRSTLSSVSARRCNMYYRRVTVRTNKIATVRAKRNAIKGGNLEKAIANFKKLARAKPVYICCICKCFKFRRQTRKFFRVRYESKSEKHAAAVQQCVPRGGVNELICVSCQRSLKAGKVPPVATANKMAPDALPDALSGLNALERHLLTPVIPFMKVAALPTSMQRGIHGPVVCVPSNVSNAVSSLPRQAAESGLIKVKLKRKLEYKGHHLYQSVDVEKLQSGLRHLKDMHPAYENITIESLTDPDLVGSAEHAQNEITSDLETEGGTSTPVEQTQSDQTVEIEGGTSTPVEHTQSDQTIESEGGTSTPVEQTHCNQTVESEGVTSTPVEGSDSDQTEETEETSAPMVTCLQPHDLAQNIADYEEDTILCLAPAEGNKPVTVFEKEASAFPTLFPNGTGAYNEKRDITVGFSQYLKARLYSSDTRFASVPEYIFYVQYLKEYREILQSIQISLRKGPEMSATGRPFTAAMLTNRDHVRGIFHNNEGFKFLRTVRGSAPYWEKCLRDLFAMVRQIGIPTWFASFSAADRRWREIADAILEQNGEQIQGEVTWTRHCEIINSNPVTAAQMFNNRFHHFLKDLIFSKAAPIGKITDYFLRVEFQQRGWPHVHALFWSSTAPKLDPDSDVNDQEVCDFIDKYVTCQLDDNETELQNIANTVQRHSKKHNKTCKKGSNKCRFNFPRVPSLRTFICRPLLCPADKDEKKWKQDARDTLAPLYAYLESDVDLTDLSTEQLFLKFGLTQETLESSLGALVKKTTIVLRRSPKDIWLNQFSKPLLLAWDANMDLQYVVDVWSCLKYILSYISKKEAEEGALLKAAQKEAREGNMEAIAELKQLGKIYLTHREVSVMEAVYRATGMNLKDCSRQVVWLPTDPHASRLSLPVATLKKRHPESDDIFCRSLLDRYLARPRHLPHFESMCLATFASEYFVYASKQSCPSGNKCIKLQDDMGFIAKRRAEKHAIIRYIRLSPDKDTERYYQNILTAFLPHKKDCLKPANYLTYEGYYDQGVVTFGNIDMQVCTIVTENMARFENRSVDLETAWDEIARNGLEQDSWEDIAPATEQERLEEPDNLADEEVECVIEDFPDLQAIASHSGHQHTMTGNVSVERRRQAISREAALKIIRSLNQSQRQLFQFVSDWCKRKVLLPETEPFYVFLTGGAGTGKSHVIKAINYIVTSMLQPKDHPDVDVTLLVAYTGTAAFNIGGQTIHSTFSIKGNPSKSSYKAVGQEEVATMRKKFHYQELLIIDEVSFISCEMLNTISERLNQLRKCAPNTRTIFGGLSVLAVGDFYQVPPMNGAYLWKEDDLVGLWGNFCMWELSQIMRQKDDLQFAEVLNRLRTRIVPPKKKQKSNDSVAVIPKEDEAMLMSRIRSPTDPDYPHAALHIFATNALVNQHNEHMLGSLASEIVKIDAVDSVLRRGKQVKKVLDMNSDSKQLLPTLKLAVNARCTLTYNIDVADGLANGVLGTVTAIIKGGMTNGQPDAVAVRFDNTVIGTEHKRKSPTPPGIDPQSVVLRPISLQLKQMPNSPSRLQYALKLAWACTIHKVQGVTVDEAVVSCKSIFREGMGYVALSRVTTLSGLTLLDYEPQRIYASPQLKDTLARKKRLSLPIHIFPLVKPIQSELKIVFHNVAGIQHCIDDIKANPEMMTVEILAILETKLASTDPSARLAMPGYQFVRSDRAHDSGGGVAFYVRNSVNFRILRLSMKFIECMAIEIANPPVVVCALYRSPTVTKTKLELDLKSLISVLPSDKHTVVGGDFNINLALSEASIPRELSSFQQLIVEPTRGKSLLDHIYVKNGPLCLLSGVSHTYYSDHEPVFYVF